MTDDDALVAGVIQYVRLGEQIRMSVVQLTHVVETLSTVHDTDAELAPELIAALEAITAATEALTRAETFAATRLEVALGVE